MSKRSPTRYGWRGPQALFVSPVGSDRMPDSLITGLSHDSAHAFWLYNRLGRSLSDIDSRYASTLRDVVFRESPLPLKLVAARWLCEVEDPAPHLKLLVEALSHAQASVQLQAITALADLGEKARPVIDDIRQATKGGEYVGRVSQRALSRLEAK